MAVGSTVLISGKKIVEAERLRDELDSLIETAKILNDKFLLKSIKRSENDLKSGRVTRIKSKEELSAFFRR